MCSCCRTLRAFHQHGFGFDSAHLHLRLLTCCFNLVCTFGWLRVWLSLIRLGVLGRRHKGPQLQQLPEPNAVAVSSRAASADSITFHGWCDGQRCATNPGEQPQAGRGALSPTPPLQASSASGEAPLNRPTGLPHGAARKQPSACCSAASDNGGSPRVQPPWQRAKVEVDRGGGRCGERDGGGDWLQPQMSWSPAPLHTLQLHPPRDEVPTPPHPPKRFPLLYSAPADAAAPPRGSKREAAPSPVCSSSVGASFTPYVPLHQPSRTQMLQQLARQPSLQDCMSAVGARGTSGVPTAGRLAAIGSTRNTYQPLQRAAPGGQQALRQVPRAVGSWSVAASSAAPEAAARVPVAQWRPRRPRSERSRPAGGAWFGADVALLCADVAAAGQPPPPPPPARRNRKSPPSRAAN